MDNKNVVTRLYNNMFFINHNLGVIMTNINQLKSVLSSSFVVDGKTIHSDEINVGRSNVKNVRLSSADVIEDLKNYF